MSRKAKRTETPLFGWLTGRGNGRTDSGKQIPYIRVSAELLQEPAFNALTSNARRCYLGMACEARDNGFTGFTFPRKTAEKYGVLHPSLCIQELCRAGFVKVLADNHHNRKANRYVFSNEWKQNPPP